VTDFKKRILHPDKKLHEVTLLLDLDHFKVFEACAEELEDGSMEDFIVRATTSFIADCCKNNRELQMALENRLAARS